MTNRTDAQSAIAALIAKQGVANSITPTNLANEQFQILLDNLLALDEVPPIKLVLSEADLGTPTDPDPAVGVYQLDDSTLYQPIGFVAYSYPIKYGTSTLIIGRDPQLDGLVYTGTRAGMIANNTYVAMKKLSYVATSGTGYEKTGTGGFITEGVVNNLKNFGSITGDQDMIISGGLTFLAGTGIRPINTGNVFFGIAETRITNSTTADPLIDYRASTINTMLIRNNEFVPSGGGVVIAADANSANVNVSADISGNSFVLALGQNPFIGTTVGDLNYVYNGNIGITDSEFLGTALLAGNTIQTPTTTQGVFVSPGGVFQIGDYDQRTLVQSAGGRIDNISIKKLIVSIYWSGTCDNVGSGNQEFKFVIYKNGVIIPRYETSISVDGNDQNLFQVIAFVELGPGEYIEPKVANLTGTQPCILKSCQLIVRGNV